MENRYDKDEITAYLNANIDEKYREFHKKLVPNVSEFLGVRLPVIKTLAKQIAKSDYRYYFDNVSCDTYEERMLRGLVIGHIKADFSVIESYIKTFVPQIDNWAVCDCFCASLKITKKYKTQMKSLILSYLNSDKEYELRFAVVMLMGYYVDSEHIDELLNIFDGIQSEAYYVKMAVAWAISLCFIKEREKTLNYLNNSNLDDWTYNKSISKIVESYRVSDVDKIILRRMKK